MTQYERMVKGLIYDPADPEIMNEQVPYQDRLWEFNQLKTSDYEKKQQRYARIALEASKQCQRSRVVTVGEIVPFEKALAAAAQADCRLFLYEKEQQKSLSAVLKSAQGNQYSVVTGPEGGFSEKEAQLAQDAGLSCVSIGPRILRCETAPLCALSAVMYAAGEF